MALRSTAVTVTTTAQALDIPRPSANNPTSWIIQVPSGGATVYIGGADVSSANGFAVGESQWFGKDQFTGAKPYVIVAASTQAIRLLVDNA